jgi:Sec-independent protein translocase protein TatA
VAGELGKGIKEFRSGLKEGEEDAKKDKPEPPATPS